MNWPLSGLSMSEPRTCVAPEDKEVDVSGLKCPLEVDSGRADLHKTLWSLEQISGNKMTFGVAKNRNGGR